MNYFFFFKVELIEEGTPRKLRVHYKMLETGEETSIECNTVCLIFVVVVVVVVVVYICCSCWDVRS